MPANLIWLASYPKSGNTWVRLFLTTYLSKNADVDLQNIGRAIPSEASLGFFTRLGLTDPADLAATYDLRPRVQRAISEETKVLRFLKTHLANTSVHDRPTISVNVTARSIYVVRNPFDVAVSASHFFGQSIDDSLVAMANNDAHLSASELECDQYLGSWGNHVLSWLTHTKSPVLRVRYEDLLQDPIAEFSKVLSFLRIPVEDDRLRKTIDAVSFDNLASMESEQGFAERPEFAERFFKSGKSYGFSEKMTREQIQTVMQHFGPIVRNLYPELSDVQ